jgi:hypothetical protein
MEHDNSRNIKMWCTGRIKDIERIIEGDIIRDHHNNRIGSIERIDRILSSKYFRPNLQNRSKVSKNGIFVIFRECL